MKYDIAAEKDIKSNELDNYSAIFSCDVNMFEHSFDLHYMIMNPRKCEIQIKRKYKS